MARVVGIGIQDFSKIREEKVFYIDKTRFIKEWWDSKDEATLITRVSKESVFSGLNHLKVVTTTSGEYADCFGFTEEEVICVQRQKNPDRKGKAAL